MHLDLGTVLTILNLIALVVGGATAAWFAFFNQRGTQRASDDAVASNLISNLQSSLTLTENTLKATNDKLDKTTMELHQMQGRNTVLEQLFNGSEGSILSFLKQAPELMRIANENHQLAKSNSEDLGKLTAAINLLVTAMTPPKQG